MFIYLVHLLSLYFYIHVTASRLTYGVRQMGHLGTQEEDNNFALNIRYKPKYKKPFGRPRLRVNMILK